MSISSLCKNGTPSGSSSSAAADCPEPRLLFVATTKSHRRGGNAFRGDGCRPAPLRAVYSICLPARRLCGTRSAARRRFADGGPAGTQFRRLRRGVAAGPAHPCRANRYCSCALAPGLFGRHRGGARWQAAFGSAGSGWFCTPICCARSATVSATAFFAEGADAAVAVSGAVYDRLRRDFLRSPDFVRLIPNGVELEQFARPGSAHAAEQRAVVRQSLALPEDALALGMVGRLDAKGQRQLFCCSAAACREVPKPCRCPGRQRRKAGRAGGADGAGAGSAASASVFYSPGLALMSQPC